MEQNSWNHEEATEPLMRASSNRDSSDQLNPPSKSKFNDAEYKRWSETLRSNASSLDNQ